MDQIRYELECPICLNLFVEPKILPSCGHTFCKPWLELVRGECNTISCPTCRSYSEIPANGLDGLHTNYIAKGIIFRVLGCPASSSASAPPLPVETVVSVTPGSTSPSASNSSEIAESRQELQTLLPQLEGEIYQGGSGVSVVQKCKEALSHFKVLAPYYPKIVPLMRPVLETTRDAVLQRLQGNKVELPSSKKVFESLIEQVKKELNG